MSYEELRRDLVISDDEDEVVMKIIHRLRERRSPERFQTRPEQERRRYVVPEMPVFQQEPEEQLEEEEIGDEPEEVREYADVEFETEELCEGSECSSFSELPTSPIGYASARRPFYQVTEAADVVDFSQLSAMEQLLPLSHVLPLNEQNLILSNAEKTGFRINRDLDKVMDKVLVAYVSKMNPGQMRDTFVRYALKRGLEI